MFDGSFLTNGSSEIIGLELKIVNIFLPVSFNISFGCSKEWFHRDGSFKYSQHIFWLRNKKIIFGYALCLEMHATKYTVYCLITSIYISQHMRFRYLTHWQAVKTQTSLHLQAASPQPLMLAYTKYGCR